MTKDQFEDMPDGAGRRATEEDYKRVWLYMKSRNRNPSVRTVCLELAAQNYLAPSVATSQRWAKKLGLSMVVEQSTTKAAEARNEDRREKRKAPNHSPEAIAEKTEKTVAQVERTLMTRMRELLKDDNSSTQLAITENRTRMAFNVALMEFYAENPSLLANVRDAAAFIDATTIASKLSGGPSIDIVLPKPGEVQADGISPGGHAMKTVNPLDKVEPALVTSFNEFKAKLREGAGT
jgi:hypothetical protein